MKFPRILVNAFISGLFFSFLLALLTLDININLAFHPLSFGRLVLALAVPYGTLAAIAVIVVSLIVRFFSGRRASIRVISPTFLALSFSLLTLVFLLILRGNVSYFESFFDKQTMRLVIHQEIILGVLAVVALGALYASRRMKNKKMLLAIFFLVFALGMAGAVRQRALYPSAQKAWGGGFLDAKPLGKKIILIGFEGLSYDVILPLISERKLPNFHHLAENGCWGRLKSLAPTESFILDHSLLSGKMPYRHRQLSVNSYRLFYGDTRLDVTPRFILFRQMIRLGLLKVLPREIRPGPKTLGGIIEAYGGTSLSIGPPAVRDKEKTAELPETEKDFGLIFNFGSSERNRLLEAARNAFSSDRALEERAFAERAQGQPQLFHLRLDGLNTVEAHFYKFAFPELFGNIAQEEITRYGTTISRYYEYYDQVIGRILTTLKEDELLVVYSPYGIEPLPLWKRFVEWILGSAEISAYHEDKPDGTVFFYGKGISKRQTLDGMSVLDMAPTLLYHLGLPVGKDMDGIVQSPLFVRDFTAENPIMKITSYEEIEIRRKK